MAVAANEQARQALRSSPENTHDLIVTFCYEHGVVSDGVCYRLAMPRIRGIGVLERPKVRADLLRIQEAQVVVCVRLCDEYADSRRIRLSVRTYESVGHSASPIPEGCPSNANVNVSPNGSPTRNHHRPSRRL